MHDVSILRLHLLRAAYLLILVGMGSQIWPLLLDPPAGVEHFRSVVWSFLGALTLLCVLGIRYPLQMLPLLLFELTWKAIWLLAIGIPRRMAGPLQGQFADTWTACVFGIVVVTLVMPWGYVVARYLRQPGDRWTNRGAPRSAPASRAAATP
jgi:hypothetical protein